ncbi:MAG: nucleotide sugar dehydrogenase [Bacteroidales bacterium]|nr:nucleotide sugar dehydrogenase [Bacteroidales bacterium]
MINVIGLGYIGLPTALMMASHGVEVIGTDYNKELVDTLNAGKTTFKEDGLDELFAEAVKAGIKFTTEYQKTDMYIVSVPTPYDKFSKKVDACYVVAAVKEVLKVCPDNATIVVESTVSPGTMDKFVRPIVDEFNKSLDLRPSTLDKPSGISLVHAPERIIPGNMVYELLHNNRTIGADSKEIGEKVKQYYASFCQGEIVVTDIRTAEMTKVVENTFRAVNIAFANELARICRHDNMDVYEIIRICNMHPRVNILQPGPGVGGHCISVDPWFLVGDYPSLAKVIDESMRTNDSQPQFVLNRIYEIMEENGITDSSRVGLYGITYKENVDDVRESPTLQMIECQERHLARPLKSFDPFFTDKEIVKNQVLDFDEFLEGIDMVVIMVKHDHIKMNWEKLKGKVILDCHNICPLESVYHI